MLIIHHIPKTGGTTWRSIVYRQFPHGAVCPIYNGDDYFYKLDEYAALPDDKKNKFEAVIGHFEYGFHRNLPPNAQPKFMTLLRDPLKRCLSLFNHLANDQYAGKVARPGELLDLEHLQFDNHQVRTLTGKPCAFGAVDAAMLAAACNRLSQFAFVGIGERFVESYACAVFTQGFKVVPYTYRNRGRSRPEYFVDRVAIEECERLERLNRFDRELYLRANGLLDQRIDRIRRHFSTQWEEVLQQIIAAGTEEVPHHSMGYLDTVGPSGIRGWAMLLQSDIPASVNAFVNGTPVGTAVANSLRTDLQAKGYEPAGRCSFNIQLPPGTSLKAGDEVRVFEIYSKRELQKSPMKYVSS